MVITGLTRNIVGSVTYYSLKLRCLSAFTPSDYALLEFCISQFSRNLVNWLCLYNFIWRRIEVVITGLTRNQLGSNPPRVRISPSPPNKAGNSYIITCLIFLTQTIPIIKKYCKNCKIVL